MTDTTEEYESPSVREYGKFEDITKQAEGKGSIPEDGASKQPSGQA